MFDVLLRVVASLSGLPVEQGAAANATIPSGNQPTPVPTDIASLWTFLWSMTALRDWAKLILLGGVLETIRRFGSSIWTTFLESFFLTAHFEGDDDAYSWMMVWLSQQPAWRKAREVQVSTRNFGSYHQTSVIVPGEEEDSLVDKRKLAFLPSFDTVHSMLYKGHWMRVTRTRRFLNEGNTQESLQINILARHHSILTSLLLDAKNSYEAEEQHRVQIYVAGSYNDWRRTGSRPKRPMESIVLDPAVKTMLLDDAKEFLASESWYAERGIPFRRGYLLWGAPGSGKTSLIHSIAGTLNLDIYIVNLAKRGLDDSGLNELICELPPRSIALIEEIDAAFHHGINRDSPNASTPGSSTPLNDSNIGGGVTLSGLLGAIDGIGAAEGRILFATTNKYHLLDAALCRPGRLDVHIKFELATKSQAEELFKCFYPVATDEKGAPSPSKPTKQTQFSTHTIKVPPIPLPERESLARAFADAIPEKEFSMAALQGLLMGYKADPRKAVEEAPRWVVKEREAAKERENLVTVDKIAEGTTPEKTNSISSSDIKKDDPPQTNA